MLKNLKKFAAWFDRTLNFVCNHPDHLQRLSIIGAGISLYPVIWAMIGILIWLGFHFPVMWPVIIPGLVNVVYGLLGAFVVVVITVLGTVRGIKLNGIGGAGIEVEMTDKSGNTSKTTISESAPKPVEVPTDA